jgi:hypothetical protein
MSESNTELKRCNQCWRFKPKSEFKGPRPNHEYQDCAECRERGRKPIENHRTGLPTDSPLRVSFVECSTNRKLGPIPSCKVTASTCPPSCAWFNHGCFGESHILREHWRRVETDGLSWGAFIQAVSQLPRGQLWRYAEVGDLPGIGESIDSGAMLELLVANHGKRGFTYTHKRSDLRALKLCVDMAKVHGFTVSVSCDNLEQVDYYRRHGFSSLVVTLPERAPDKLITPEGYTVRVCWAELDDTVTCFRCRACANPSEKRPVIAFRAHGQCKQWVSTQADTQAYRSAISRGPTLPVVR